MTQKKLKKTVDWKIIVFGLACITAIEIYALSQGINGAILTGVIATIGVVIGVTIPNPIKS